MKSAVYFLACATVVAGSLLMNIQPAIAADDVRDQLEKRVYRNEAGESLPYRLFVPKDYDPNKKYPLILFLHGAGERGNDNEAQLKHAQILRFASDEVQAKHPAFIVAPQCPSGKVAAEGGDHRWVQKDWSARASSKMPEKPSFAMARVLELLDALDKEFSIDADRRYVTGLSMGGYGTLDLLMRRPDYFAAAIPICGGGDESQAASIVHIPVWLFHGDKDTAVPVERSRNMVAALKKAGGSPKYTEYAGQGHAVWGPAYEEPELVEWVYAQKRMPKPAKVE